MLPFIKQLRGEGTHPGYQAPCFCALFYCSCLQRNSKAAGISNSAIRRSQSCLFTWSLQSVTISRSAGRMTKRGRSTKLLVGKISPRKEGRSKEQEVSFLAPRNAHPFSSASLILCPTKLQQQGQHPAAPLNQPPLLPGVQGVLLPVQILHKKKLPSLSHLERASLCSA